MEEGEEYKNDLIFDEKMGSILEGRNDGIKIEVQKMKLDINHRIW